MVQKIIYAVYPESEWAMQNFIERMIFAGVQTKKIKSSDKYNFYESSWDDSEISKLNMQKKNPRNAGAKQKELNYNGKPVLCSTVFLLKSQKKVSNTQIANLFDVSESTISRRIKKHTEDGNFHEKSKVIF